MKVARIYMRVSTEEQDLSPQEAVLEKELEMKNFYDLFFAFIFFLLGYFLAKLILPW